MRIYFRAAVIVRFLTLVIAGALLLALIQLLFCPC